MSSYLQEEIHYPLEYVIAVCKQINPPICSSGAFIRQYMQYPVDYTYNKIKSAGL